jgi:hypothetical protein
LVRDDDDDLDAAGVFATLEPKPRRAVLDRFDLWIDGKEFRDNYFHGWPNNPKYKQSFVFKWKYKNRNHRLYGFLCHPQRKTRPQFQLCVLISHATKNDWETDPSELDGANELSVNSKVIAVIRSAFPDARAGEKEWRN